MSTNPLVRALQFRESVVLSMNLNEIPARMMPRGSKLSELLLDSGNSDILGVPGWLVNTKFETTRDLSTALDHADKEAAEDGISKAVVVWYRPSRPVGDSYVVMTLRTFEGVLRDEQAGAA